MNNTDKVSGMSVDERFELDGYKRRLYEAINYRGKDDHEDVTSILLEYRRNLLREKDEQIFKLENRLKECENGYEGTLYLERCKIAEKDAEIERKRERIVDLKCEIERLTEENKSLRDNTEVIIEMVTIARAEAIEEFVGKLKEAVKYIPWCDYPPVINCIDQIAKELKEDQM